MYKNSIKQALSLHGANSNTLAVQAMVESVISNIPRSLAKQLIEELKKTSTVEQLESTLVWQQVLSYQELRKNFTENCTYKEDIALALSLHGANSNTFAVQAIVESIIDKTTITIAGRLIEELKKTSTIEQLKSTLVWQQVLSYQELRKNFTGSTIYENAIASYLSLHGANSDTFAIQAMVVRAISNIPIPLANQLVGELKKTSTVEQLKRTLVWQHVLAYQKTA